MLVVATESSFHKTENCIASYKKKPHSEVITLKSDLYQDGDVYYYFLKIPLNLPNAVNSNNVTNLNRVIILQQMHTEAHSCSKSPTEPEYGGPI